MENIRLIVVDSEEEVTNSIKKYFGVSNSFTVVSSFKDGQKAFDYISENKDKFDVLITDLLVPNIDGLALITKLKKMNIDKKCIVLSSYMNNDVVKNVCSLGVDFFMLKPFSLESLEERISDLYKVRNYESNKNANLELEISELLHNLGVPSHVRGYKYIRDGVMYIFNKNSYVNYITKEIYPEIADKYDTTSSRVERAIRHAIEISWDRGDLNLMEELFGHSIDYDRSKPTNSEYINTLADRLKIKNKEILI